MTTCWQLMWCIITTALKSCLRPCVTFADREAVQRCCGPTRSGSSQTWGSRSVLRAVSTQCCWLSSHSMRWGYTKPQRRSDGPSEAGEMSNFKECVLRFFHPCADLNQHNLNSVLFWFLFFIIICYNTTFLDIAVAVTKQKADMKLNPFQ